jgi:hypothetical protein
VFECVFVCVYICVYVCVCMYVSVNTLLYFHKKREENFCLAHSSAFSAARRIKKTDVCACVYVYVAKVSSSHET